MGGERRDRHQYKELLQGLEYELRHDYGLTVVASRALIRRLAEFIEQKLVELLVEQHEGIAGCAAGFRPTPLARLYRVQRQNRA